MIKVLKAVPLSAIDTRSLIDADASAGHVTILEITLLARELVAPLHRHTREDEHTFVLAGQIGAQLGQEVISTDPGDLIFKPRDQWHTFWNAGDEPARVLEIICPSGFERFFAEFSGDVERLSPETSRAIGARYGLEFDFSSAPGLMQEHDVMFGGKHQ